MKRILVVIASCTFGFAVTPALAASRSGTGLTASVSTASHLTTTYVWSLAKSADPATQMVAVGTSATVHWTITATRSASGTLGGYVDGRVCVSNTGRVATQGLAIGVAISAPPSSSVLAAVSVDVSARPVLAAGASWCYPYQATLPATALMPGATYKASAQVSVTNHSGSLGMASGPPPSAPSLLPTTPIPIDSAISVSDSNGKTFTFASGGSQGYDQSIACASADGPHTISQSNTATIQSTAQSAKATASVQCGWQAGDLTTYGQGEWPNAFATTPGYFNVYEATGGALIVGLTNGYYIVFDSGLAVQAYFPKFGTPAALNAILFDPTLSASGEFGGNVVALKLNVDFSDAGLLAATSNLKFGDLTVCGLNNSDLNGHTVRDFLGVANIALGGGTTSDSIADLDTIASELNAAFESGTPSTFALQHLAMDGTCQTVAWVDGDITTLDQQGWASSTLLNKRLLYGDYFTVYPDDLFEVGIATPCPPCLVPDNGFQLLFDNGQAVSNYLPQTGQDGVLDVDLFDPTDSASGAFGGDVVALKLNVDFSAAGLLQAKTGLKFGDLTICGLSSDTDLNGMSVRAFLDAANVALGALPHTDSIDDLDRIAFNLNASFADKAVSAWAQDHLAVGACQ